jgi:hypothetical protein
MKKSRILAVFALAAVFAGCSQIEDSGAYDSAAGRCIGFSPLTPNPKTKAAALISTDLLSFNVLGIKDNATVLANLDNKEVSRAGSDGVWTYDPVEHWPEAGSKVRFYAVSTNGGEGNKAAPAISWSAPAASITYTVPTAAADQVDLLVSTTEEIPVTYNIPDKVSLTMLHALSRIQLSVNNIAAAGGNNIIVKEVRLLNLYPTGTLVLNETNVPPAGYTWETTVTPWEVSGEKVNYSAGLPAGGVKVVPDADNGDESTVVVGPGAGDGGEDNSVMILPQLTELGTGAVKNPPVSTVTKFYLYLKVGYTDAEDAEVTYTDATGTHSEDEYYIPIPDPENAGEAVAFEAGKEYLITITADPDYIPKVEFANIQAQAWQPAALTQDVSEVTGYNWTGTYPDATSANYTPPTHSGWAGSNIYWDAENHRLTFDGVGETAHQNYQGLFFKWGSLIGISPEGNFSASKVIYAPGDFNYYEATTMSDFYGSGTYTSITNNNPTSTSLQNTQNNLVYLNNTPPTENSYKGDICAYLSGQPGTPKGRWRMPTQHEFQLENWAVSKSDEQPAPNVYGTALVSGGILSEENVFLPAGGGLHEYGTNNWYYNTSTYWTATAGNQTSTIGIWGSQMIFDDNIMNASLRHRATPIRCVRI